MNTEIYTYKHNPLHEGAFQIFKSSHSQREDQLVGDYILLDKLEDISLTEKKVINLVSLLNGREDIIDLRAETESRLYHQALEKGEDGRSRVLFRTFSGERVSQENAIFSYEEEAFS